DWQARCRRATCNVRAGATMPATKGATDFSHTRHSLRVIFHQHALPGDIPAAADESLIDLGDRGWQFLATTEHSLAGVAVQRSESGDITVTGEIKEVAAWSTVQEIRFCSRKKLLALATDINAAQTIDPQDSGGLGAMTRSGFATQDKDVAARLVTA